MSNFKSHFDATVLDRLKQALGITTDRKLAEYLEINPTVIANWRSRGRINATRVLSKCEFLDINWILFGKRVSSGPVNRDQIYEEREEVVERNKPQSEQVQEEDKEIVERMKTVERENIGLRSKIEVLEDLIIRLKKDSG